MQSDQLNQHNAHLSSRALFQNQRRCFPEHARISWRKLFRAMSLPSVTDASGTLAELSFTADVLNGDYFALYLVIPD